MVYSPPQTSLGDGCMKYKLKTSHWNILLLVFIWGFEKFIISVSKGTYLTKIKTG